MRRYVVISFILYSINGNTQTLPSNVAYTPEQIVSEKVTKVNNQNGDAPSATADTSIFNNSRSSHGVNLSSVSKSQQVGLDLHKEADDLRNKVVQEQSESGTIDPQGCADRSSLNEYHSNVCLASDTLQVMGIEAIESQNYFKESAERSYETMEDTSAFPLDGSGTSNFAADSHGLPTQSNGLYSENKKTIDSFHQLYKSLDETSQYKGFKYNTKNDYFYLDGKKYPTSVMYSKDAMIKAGIRKSLADFVYKMLEKKAAAAQSKVTAMLKKKNIYDGKNWNIVKVLGSGKGSNDLSRGVASEMPSDGSSQIDVQKGVQAVDLSSSLVEEKTLFKELNGVPVGLSSDNIFEIISRKYREKDRKGFFHNSSKK
ncbi:MAG: hypothetical protein JNM24_10845 [Bdellovibrionaceae bacterium]|nr:hypothetical protein [Pseudobdellovibrionaceae bacterium]